MHELMNLLQQSESPWLQKLSRFLQNLILLGFLSQSHSTVAPGTILTSFILQMSLVSLHLAGGRCLRNRHEQKVKQWQIMPLDKRVREGPEIKVTTCQARGVSQVDWPALGSGMREGFCFQTLTGIRIRTAQSIVVSHVRSPMITDNT